MRHDHFWKSSSKARTNDKKTFVKGIREAVSRCLHLFGGKCCAFTEHSEVGGYLMKRGFVAMNSRFLFAASRIS